MSTEPLNDFQTAKELRDNQAETDATDTKDVDDGGGCVNSYHCCPGPDDDRPSCDDCRIIGQLLDDEIVGRLDK